MNIVNIFGILVLLVFLFVLCFSEETTTEFNDVHIENISNDTIDSCDKQCDNSTDLEEARGARTLIHPPNFAAVQVIFGAGIPVPIKFQFTFTGLVIKNVYRVPNNSSYYTNPDAVYQGRKKRSLNEPSPTPSRWDLYKMFTKYSEMFAVGGKDCVLRTICELSSTPLERSISLYEEILHIVFTPSTTEEEMSDETDKEYLDAERFGRNIKLSYECEEKYQNCSVSLTEMFTKYLGEE